MNRRMTITLIAMMIAALMISVFAAGCSQGGADAEGGADVEDSASGGELSEGDKAPDFTVQLANGSEFTLSDHKDEVVLLNFWATWCPPCVGEMPELQKIEEAGMEGVKLIAVDCMETKDEVDAFIKENGLTFDIAYDEDGAVEQKYPTAGIPYTLIIKDGVIRSIFMGAPQDPYSVYTSAIESCLE